MSIHFFDLFLSKITTYSTLPLLYPYPVTPTMSEAEAILSPPNGGPSLATPDLSSWLEITQQAATLIDPKVRQHSGH
jgi:hypothetical protein